MIQVNGSIRIEAPCRDVWEFIRDAHRFPEWVDSILEMVDLPSEGLNKGSMFQEYGYPGPFRGYTLWRVVESKSPSIQIHKGVQGVMLFIVERHLEPKGEATLFEQTVSMRFHTIMKPVEWILSGKMRRNAQNQLTRTLNKAKQLIELEHADVS